MRASPERLYRTSSAVTFNAPLPGRPAAEPLAIAFVVATGHLLRFRNSGSTVALRGSTHTVFRNAISSIRFLVPLS